MSAVIFDYEEQNVYALIVTVDDGNEGTDSINVTVNVVDVNENTAPSFNDDDSTERSIAENSAAGTDIGTPVAATDHESDTLTYTLIGNDSDKFTLNTETGQLQTNAPLNFEDQRSYTLAITVSDGALTDSIAVKINVTDVNENPMFTEDDSTNRSIQESADIGTDVGTAITARDVDENTTLTYSLSETDTFRIDSDTGQLQTVTTLDFETTPSYTLTVTASDGELTATIAVTVNVTFVNNPPVFREGDTAVRSIAEHTAKDENIGEPISASDEDTLTYSINGTDADSFTLDTSTGQLKVNADLNYEDRSTYSVYLTVTDGELTDNIVVTIDLIDINDAPEFDEGESTTRSIPEDTTGGSNIGTEVAADDPDEDELTYSLSGRHEEWFSLDASTGQLRTASDLDFESTSEFFVTITVTDGELTDEIDVKIDVSDVNDSPGFALSAYAPRAIAENTAASAAVGSPIVGTDVDSTGLTYSIEGEDADSFTINSESGQIRTAAPLDYEKKKVYSVEVIVSDGELTNRLALTINIRDVNEAPEFEDSETTRDIDENTVAGTNIGASIEAMDQDDAHVLTYTLGGPDAAFFAINSETGQLLTSAPLNFEDRDVYEVVVTVTDNGGLTDMIDVTININDINDAPEFTEGDTASREIDENTAANQNIGDPVVATDEDTSATWTYSLGGADAATFGMNTDTGQLFTSAALNFEDVDTYEVTITVTDNGGLTDTIAVTIDINDINEAPEFTEGDSTTRNIDENTTANQNIGAAVAATDQDNGATRTYTLGGTDASFFDINADTGQLLTSAPLNFEDVDTYEVTITVTDNGGLTDAIDVRIDINDINDAPEFSEGEDTSREIDENTVANANIGDPVVATDEDVGATRTYSLGGTDAAAFAIDSATGQLLTSAPLNYEDVDEYEVSITVTDNGGLTDTIDVTIYLKDVNDPPEFTDDDPTTRSVDENVPNNTPIGDPVEANDEDLGYTLIYSLEGTNAGAFNIESTTGQLLRKRSLNHENKDTYSVIVKVTDDGGLTDTIAVTISVNDLNEAPNFVSESVTLHVNENTASGETIANFTASEQDEGDTTTYSLEADSSDPLAYQAFNIVSTSGILETKDPLDYETNSIYKFTVKASDSGGLFDTVDVTISVRNVNERPVFTEDSDTDRAVDENTAANMNIGAPVEAKDEDLNQTLTYQLRGEDRTHFAIDSSNGQLKTKEPLDHEGKGTYSIVVRARDNGSNLGGSNTNLTASINVTITVNDVNEAPYFGHIPTIVNIDENTPSGQNIGSAFRAIDPDDGDTDIYTLEGSEASLFSIVSDNGQLRTKAALDHEDEDSHHFTIRVTDSGGLTDTHPVRVDVNDVAEAPRFPSSTITLSVNENTAVGNNIGSPIPAATDDDGDNIAYTLGGTDASHFTFDTGTRQLKTNTVFNYDTDAKTSYTVTVTATDDSTNTLSSFVTVTVNVNDLEFPPQFDSNSVSLSINENSVVGTDIGSPITATDQDGDTPNYTLEGTDAADFDIESASGQLKTKNALDYEDKDTYSLIVRATDEGGLSDTIDVTVNVVDVNEVPEFREGSTTTRSVNENAIVGAAIGDPVSASGGDGDTLEYTLGGTDAAKFTLESTNGQLKVKELLDHDADDSHDVTITATDPDGSTANIAVTIEVQPPQITTPLADRSPRARATILAAVRALDDVDDNIQLGEITLEHLQSITYMQLDRTETQVALNSGDFDDLTSLTELVLYFRGLTENNVPTDIFRGLAALETLSMRNNEFTTLKSGIFDGLTALKSLNLGNNTNITTLPSDVFDELSALEELSLYNNRFTTLTSGIFDKLTALETLNLTQNRFTTLSTGIFDKLTALKSLKLDQNRINTLPSDIFDELAALEGLTLDQNRFAAIPDGIFDELTTLKSLNLSKNRITAIPSMIFDDLAALETLDLSENQLTSFAAADFNGLVALKSLKLNKNTGVTSLPEDLFTNTRALTALGLSYLSISTLLSDIFNGLTSLETINLSDSNYLTSLPADIFDGLNSLKNLNLYNSSFGSLPDGIFAGVLLLSTLHLRQYSIGDFLMNISLVAGENAGEFKARYHVGAVTNTNVKVKVNNGTIDGETADTDGIYTIAIAQGSVDSNTYTVSRTSGTTGAVSVYIDSLEQPNRPSGHSGYKLMNQTPSGSPLEIYAAGAGAPTSVNNTSATPTVTTMLPNFPNPFNPETWIPYQLSKASDVTITIYNMRGVVVRELALGHQKAGYYTTRKRAAYWDGRNDIGERVAAGVYFTTFKAGDFTATRKMLIRK